MTKLPALPTITFTPAEKAAMRREAHLLRSLFSYSKAAARKAVYTKALREKGGA